MDLSCDEILIFCILWLGIQEHRVDGLGLHTNESLASNLVCRGQGEFQRVIGSPKDTLYLALFLKLDAQVLRCFLKER